MGDVCQNLQARRVDAVVIGDENAHAAAFLLSHRS
jgi:hypothetical protein